MVLKPQSVSAIDIDNDIFIIYTSKALREIPLLTTPISRRVCGVYL